MRQLEVVAVSEDGTLVLLAGSEDAVRPTHQLRIDERLAAAIRGDLDDSEPRESELTPKEIQARLRAGDSVEQVAQAARVPVNRVMRYAGPVMSERDRVVEQARATKLQRPRGAESLTALGTVVEQRLAATAGLRADSVEWDARRRDDGAWIVSLTYAARGGSRTAQWLWQPAGRELTSINALGTRLGADEPAASPRRRPASASTATRRKSAAGGKAAKRKPARPAASRAPRKAATAKRASASRRSVPKAAAAARRGAGKSSASSTNVKSAASSRPLASSKRAAAAAARRRAATPARARTTATRTGRATPPPVVEPVTKRTNGRVPIPSWDDVLLGVQRPAARGRRRS